MNRIASSGTSSRIHSGVFHYYLKQLEEAVESLHRKRTKNIRKRIEMWKSTWENGYDRRFDAPRSDVLQFGLLLGRLAESYSFNGEAEEVLNLLAESALGQENWIADPPSVLITAGEFNRRRGDLDQAERRYREAVRILEQDLAGAKTRLQIHKELGRLFYELAYLHRLRGDAGATRSALERSEAECVLAEDKVGTEIARTLLAAVLYEKGLAESSIAGSKECLARFEQMVEDPAIIAAGRAGLVRRWVINARIHLAQAYLSAGHYDAARTIIEEYLVDENLGVSTSAFAVVKRVEAKIRLAAGDLSLAHDAIAASWKAIEEQPGGTKSTEHAAATIVIAGVTNALMKSGSSAMSCFEEACSLPPDLHNRRAQAWAWAGRAILAREAGDEGGFRDAVCSGLEQVQRSGAPIRAFLLTMLQHSYSIEGCPGMSDLKVLLFSTG